jgi:arsenical pump membrane protein
MGGVQAIAFGSLTLTLTLVLARPRIGRFGRLNPVMAAIPGLLVMLAFRVLSFDDVRRAMRTLWRPLVTIVSIMATTSVAHRLGIFDRVARAIEVRTRGDVPRAYLAVYVIGTVTAAVFNNDAAILLLTPIVLPLIRHLYPKRPYLVVPFAFAVFMSAGVAPLCTSNPMNLVVAEHAGLGFNAYALRMVPVAIAGSIVSYAMLRFTFRKELDDRIPARGTEQGPLPPMRATSTMVLAVVIAMFAAYPVLSYFEAPVWMAAAGGAAIICAVGLRDRAVTIDSIRRGVAWDVLAFLFCIFLTALGLENAGITRVIGEVYGIAGGRTGAEIATVGVASAIGSAVLNNHPMAALNALVVGAMSGDARWRTLAALVGGDLGPRLLPLGSLAGLLWIEMARRLDVEIRTRDFVRVGVVATVPTLAASLGVLAAEAWVIGP